MKTLRTIATPRGLSYLTTQVAFGDAKSGDNRGGPGGSAVAKAARTTP
jgi:hypothetical protein